MSTKIHPICLQCAFYIVYNGTCSYNEEIPNACFYLDEYNKQEHSVMLINLQKKNKCVNKNAKRAYRRIRILRYGIDKAIEQLPLNSFDAKSILRDTLKYKLERYKEVDK